MESIELLASDEAEYDIALELLMRGALLPVPIRFPIDVP